MNPELELTTTAEDQNVTPSVDLIHALSEFFETDPDDLLMEMGYYHRDAAGDAAAK